MLTVVWFVLVAAAAAEKRLIAFNDTTAVWMDSKTVEKLMSAPTMGKGFMDITDHQQATRVSDDSKGDIPVDPRFPETVGRINALLRVDPLVETITHLSSYATRYYTTQTGLQAAEWIRARYAAIAGSRSDISVRLYQHTGWLQPSVIATIRGASAAPDDGIVIIGGHEDSTSNGATAPGADDDGSGTASVLEAFRAIVESGFRPDRTVEFHAYAAEEAGLRGSQAIAQDYAARGVVVAGMLNLDMTGYNPNNRNMLSMITDFTSAPLTALVRKLVAAYTDVRNTDSRCGYACSDHASWNRAGYAAAMPAEAVFGQHNPNIHTVRDTMAFVSGPYALQFSRIAVSFAVEMSMN